MKLFPTVMLLIVSTITINNLYAQNGNVYHVNLFSKIALKKWAEENYTLKKIHSVDILEWNYNSYTEKYSIRFYGKWEDIGFFFDDEYEDEFKLICDYKGCNSTLTRNDYDTNLNCLEHNLNITKPKRKTTSSNDSNNDYQKKYNYNGWWDVCGEINHSDYGSPDTQCTKINWSYENKPSLKEAREHLTAAWNNRWGMYPERKIISINDIHISWIPR